MLDSLPAPDVSGPFRRAPLWLNRGALLRACRLAIIMLGFWMSVCVIPAQPSHAEEKLPLPRFASFKSSEVNLRSGPGEERPILWVYQRANMPVEIFYEFDTWRQIRDYQGVVGWVSVNLLSSKRTAIVIETRRTLHESADATSPAVALLEPGVIGKLLECSGDWCRLEVKGYEGWLKRTEIWGVNGDENFKE